MVVGNDVLGADDDAASPRPSAAVGLVVGATVGKAGPGMIVGLGVSAVTAVSAFDGDAMGAGDPIPPRCSPVVGFVVGSTVGKTGRAKIVGLGVSSLAGVPVCVGAGVGTGDTIPPRCSSAVG